MESYESCIQYIKDIFRNDFSGHDAEHSLRVYRTAMTIAKETEEANPEIVALASLLHDVDDVKLFPDHHHYENARKFMKEHQIPEEEQNQICLAISQVSFKGKDSVTPDTIEGMIVQDADRLDAIGAIGIARTFSYGGSHHRPIYISGEKYLSDMDEETYRNHQSSSLAHFYEKLLLLKDMMNTKKAKQMAEERHKFMLAFLQEFSEENEGKR